MKRIWWLFFFLLVVGAVDNVKDDNKTTWLPSSEEDEVDTNGTTTSPFPPSTTTHILIPPLNESDAKDDATADTTNWTLPLGNASAEETSTIFSTTTIPTVTNATINDTTSTTITTSATTPPFTSTITTIIPSSDTDTTEDTTVSSTPIPVQLASPTTPWPPPLPDDPYCYEDFRRRCPAESRETIWWNETCGGVIAARRCPLGYTGSAYRMCFYGGNWGDVDYSECRIEQLIRLKHMVYYHVHKNLTDGFHGLAEELLRILRSYKLRSLDDVMEALDVLNIMLNSRMRLDLRLPGDVRFVKTVMEVGDMLFTRQDEGWLPPRNQQDLVTLKLVQVLHCMGYLSIMVADGLKRSGMNSYQVDQLPHVGLLAEITDSKQDYVFQRFHENDTSAQERITVPIASHRIPGTTNHYVVVTLWYRGFNHRLEDQNTLVNSDILTTSVHPGRGYRVSGPVTITLYCRQEYNKEDFHVECGYLRKTSNRSSLWSSAGCSVIGTKGREVTCRCHHVSNVAVILRRIHREPSKPRPEPVSIVVLVGCGVALVTLLLTFLSHVHLLRSDISESTLILLNLVISLATGQIVFMAGIQATENKEICEGISIMLHYLHLVASFWMLSHGIHLYLRLRHCDETKPPRHMRDYCLLSWVVPVILVVITFIVNPKGYETKKYCWLSIERGMLLSFMVPISTLIMINTTLMVLVLKHFFEMKAVTRKTEIDKTRASLRAGVVLLPFFGVNWFIGVLALEDTTTYVFEAAYAVTNSLQGFLIFIFYCVFNTEIRHSFRRISFIRRKNRKSLDLKLKRSRKRKRRVDAEPLLLPPEQVVVAGTVNPTCPETQEVAT